ncbi:hypothetical protein [Pseudonocardia sp. HH130630-07]|uniref:hypothetical protein n=1 Tax=Pseudonocardia sp. HH130630-07 TaxID=1690815 RepID=UPI0018D44EAA|nr:hypothetical protein [Pseudonocardia sp. HH130630-07]
MYVVIRARARAGGRSIRSYMRDVVVDVASRPTADEVFAAMDEVNRSASSPVVTRAAVIADLAELRR